MKRNKQFQSFPIMIILLIQIVLTSNNMAVEAIITSNKWVTGGVFPSTDDIQLKLINADILYEINAEEYKEKFHLSFEGNYTIQNIGNELNVSLVAPFLFDAPPYISYLSDLENLLVIRIEEIELPFNCIHQYYTRNWTSWSPNEAPLNNTFDKYWDGYFVITNFTIPKDSTINIDYNIATVVERYWSSLYKLVYPFDFAFIIGTLKAWQEEITARVRVIVKGKEPTRFSDYNEIRLFFKECNVSKSGDKTLYEWNWNKESVDEDFIIIYYEDTGRISQRTVIISIVVPISFILVPTFLIFLYRYRKKDTLNDGNNK